jgi:hypothetical protein
MTGCTTQHDQFLAEMDRVQQESQNHLARLQREADERDAVYPKTDPGVYPRLP